MPKYIDIAGLRSGQLVAQRYVGHGKWECLCDCGNIKIARGDHIRERRLKSCGCLGVGKFIDVTGQMFGDLCVVRRIGKSIPVRWECRCEKCGSTVEVDSFNLRHGIANPCICSQKKRDGNNSPTFKHGCSHTRLYNIWQGMLNRCRNENVERYDCYGGRGIQVCDEWRQFEPFQSWSLSHGYSDTLSIDRIDVDGNYTPENCRWIPLSEQAANRRKRKA